MRYLLLVTLLLVGCAKPPEPGYYYPAIAVGYGLSAIGGGQSVVPIIPVTPIPVAPVTDLCPKCKGTGKAKFGRREIPCRACDGTGHIKPGYAAINLSGWLIAPDQDDMAYYGQALALSKEKQLPLLIDFCPDWCVPCYNLKRNFFERQDTINVLDKQFVLLRVKDGDVANAFHIEDKYERPYPLVAIVALNGNFTTFRPVAETFLADAQSKLNSLGD